MSVWPSSHLATNLPGIFRIAICEGRRAIMITVRLVALALGLAVAASTSFAQVPAPPPTGLSQRSMPVSDGRAEAIADCTKAAAKYVEHVWANWNTQTYRSCMARRDQQE